MSKFKLNIENVISQIKDLNKKSTKPILVAIDGRSGAGKSTIAKQIASRLNGIAISSDDFWIGGSDEEWDKCTPQEKSDRAIDWKRIRTEVLEPLLEGKPAVWRSFNSRPELQDIIDLSILVEISEDTNRRERLIKREGKDYMSSWHKRWDPAEDYYFSSVRPKSSFDIIITND